MSIFKELNLKYPIFQGAMANISDAKLAAAVSNAGGLGIIACGSMDKELLKEQIKMCKKLTDKPFGINLMLMSPYVSDLVDLVIEEKIRLVTTGAGNPGPYMGKLKAAGIIVVPLVPSVALAKRVVRSGADAVVVEGTEAGGHIGELTTMALVPQVVDAVDVEVIAAGGIADGRGVAAAFALGASGIQAGTAFLVTKECGVHDNYKKAIIKAKDTSTTVTGRGTAAPVRVLKNKMAKEYNRIIKEGIDLIRLEYLTLDSLKKAARDGDMENGSLMSGQISGMITEEVSCAELIEKMFSEFKTVVKNLGKNHG